MLKWFPAIVVLLLSVACAQAPVRDEDSQWMRITAGSHIKLNQTLAVPAGQARVFMQNGKVVAKHRLNQYHPFCNFEINSVSDGTLQITPDTFIVTNVIDNETEVVSNPGAFMHAAWRTGHGLTDDSMPMVTRYVQHSLHSSHQPQVMRLTCYSGFGETWQLRYPSVSEIRQTMGGIATVELAGI